MAAFSYEALDEQGKTVTGVMEGDVARQVRVNLRKNGLTPLRVDSLQAPSSKTSRALFHRKEISGAGLAILTRQFATLVRAGLTIEESLAALVDQADSERARALVAGLRGRVVEGQSLARAMGAYPRAFPEIYLHMVEAGEQSGHLDQVLDRLASYTESRRALQQKVVLALVYPALLTLVAVGVVVGLLVSVVPQVTRVFVNSGQTLPWTTRALMHLSDALRAAPAAWLAGLAAFVFLARLIFKTPGMRERLDLWGLRLPLLGRLVRGLNAARMTSTLGILTASGVSLLTALESAAQVVTNRPMKAAMKAALQDVSEGRALSQSIGKSNLFPPLMIHLMASGESSGQLDVMLQRAAEAQTQELETWVAALTALFEPVLILAMGGVVLFIVLAILSPIMEMNQLVR